jgi:Uma2 family endonuclease
MVTTKRVYTLTDLLDLPDDDQLYEILGGELVVQNAPDTNHALIVAELTGVLLEAQNAGYGYALTGPYAVAFDFPRHGMAAEDVTHPDLLFVASAREAAISQRFLGGVPDLVIEVLSPYNRERDLVEKLEVHRRSGVPYYWIVDPPARAIRQYTLVGEPYQAGEYGPPATLGEGDMLACPLFPGVSAPVARIFRNVRDWPRRT